jgi:hypothetical protein
MNLVKMLITLLSLFVVSTIALPQSAIFAYRPRKKSLVRNQALKSELSNKINNSCEF